MDVTRASRDVYPPRFCRWRMLLAIMAVTQLSVLLMGLGRNQLLNPAWLSVVSSYAQCLALFCAGIVCTLDAWLARLGTREAWLGHWFIVLLCAIAFSYLCGVMGTVLGVGPGQEHLASFMLKSALAVGMVHGVLLRYLYIRSQWQQELQAQADARVQALQSRIRPHFLFNSLNTIASLVVDKPELAERATIDLADLFRGSMRRADTKIPLSEELSLAKKYLEMEQRRLGEKMTIVWDVAELPGDVRVLPLVLQPLLENAVLHGVQALEQGGQVRVFGTSHGQSLSVTISNPVPEASDDELPIARRTDGNGMALGNIRRRLELAHGELASLLTEQADGYFYAVLTLPSGGVE